MSRTVKVRGIAVLMADMMTDDRRIVVHGAVPAPEGNVPIVQIVERDSGLREKCIVGKLYGFEWRAQALNAHGEIRADLAFALPCPLAADLRDAEYITRGADHLGPELDDPTRARAIEPWIEVTTGVLRGVVLTDAPSWRGSTLARVR